MRGFSLKITALAACAFLAAGAIALPAYAGGKAKWTFALYMCSDNDLDDWAATNVEWLEEVGSSEDVNFVVLWTTNATDRRGSSRFYLGPKKTRALRPARR